MNHQLVASELLKMAKSLLAGTSCAIVIPSGSKYYGITCHYDGYPDGVGKMLKQHYRNDRKIEELLDLGNISVLGEEIGEQHDFATHGRNPKADKWTLAYGRDRGEKGQRAKMMSMSDLHNNSYYYIWQDDEWHAFKSSDDQEIPL